MKLRKLYSITAMLVVVLMTGCKKDDDPAVVTPTEPISNHDKFLSNYPISDATNVDINHKIAATFSVEMDASMITKFTLQQGTTPVPGATAYTGTTTSFTPAADLAKNTLYKATITSGEKDYVWRFTTGAIKDTTLPTVTLTDPANSALGVTLKHTVVTTFSEIVDQTTVTSQTFSLKQGSTAVSGAVTYTGTKATFTSASDLEPNKIYTGTITTGTKDMAGNALSSAYTFSFATGDAPDILAPAVNSIVPLNNAACVARDQVVSVDFSEQMGPLTINASTFTLTQGATAVSGTVAYCASCSGTTATFTPSATLDAYTNYCVTITTGAKDLAGNPFAANYVWCFTTGGSTSTSPSTPLVVDLGAAGNWAILAKSAITNVPTSSVIGNVGLSPAATSYITGFALTASTDYTLATSSQVAGNIYGADMNPPTAANLTMAISAMEAAYTDLSTRPAPDYTELGDGNIGGRTLLPGLYKWTSTLLVPTDVTLSGCADDAFIFQIAGNLTVSSAVNFILSGGAQAKNIYWVVAGEATIGTTAHFEGSILSMTGINLQTGASMNGRGLAQTAVTLDQNSVTKP